MKLSDWLPSIITIVVIVISVIFSYATLKAEVNHLRQDMNYLRQDMNHLRQDIKEIRVELRQMNQNHIEHLAHHNKEGS